MTMKNLTDQTFDQMRFERAQKRVRQISGFYKHLIIYIIINSVNLIIQGINLEKGEQFLSFGMFSMAFFWGVGLAIHALSTFGPGLVLGNDWEERKIKEFMDKEKRQGQKWE